MASNNSAKPILVAGGVGAFALLAVAWIFTASTGNRAEREAAELFEEVTAEHGELALLEVDAADEGGEAAASEEGTAEAADAPTEETEAEEVPEDVTETAEADGDAEEAEAPAEETDVAEAEPKAEAAEEPESSETDAAEAETSGDETAAGATQTAALGGDAAAGEKVFRKCKACHQVGDGAANRVGPQLNNIIGAAKGGVADFNYSKVFQEANAAGETWTPEALDAYLEAPREAMKGTKMAFAGLRKEEDRTDVIAYLGQYSTGGNQEAAAETETEETETAAADAAETETAEAEASSDGGAAEETEAASETGDTDAAEQPAEETETAEAAGTEDSTQAAEEGDAADDQADTAEAENSNGEGAAAVQTADLGGDPEAGEKVFRKCKACHQVGEGAKNRVGPVLTGIIGSTKGSVEGFNYSPVFQEANAAGETWTPEALDAYLEKPREAMKGTKMAFAGLRKDVDRADVIAYLAQFE